MEKYQQLLKLFITLCICTIFIFSASYFGSHLFEKNTSVNTASDEVQKAVKNSKTETVSAQPKQGTLINEASVRLDGVSDGLQTFLANNAKIELPPQSSFSLLDLAKKQKLESIDSEALNMIATGIYLAVLPTNFTIEERDISSELPIYAKLGFEARVDPAANEDLVFLNPNQTSYLLELKQDGSNLIVDLKGEKLQYNYKISTKEAQQLQSKVVTQYSPLLMTGQTRVTDPGKDGQTIEVFRDVYQGGLLVKSEMISNDYYPPDCRVVVQALSVPSTPAATDNSTGNGTPAASSQQSGTSASTSTNTSTNSSASQTTQDIETAYGS